MEEKTEESRHKRAQQAADGFEGDEEARAALVQDEFDRMEAEEGSVKEVTERIMEAYDRLHPEDEYALLHMDRLP